MLTLKQISHLNAIIRHQTIHRAAETLHITQPALTRSLTKLEATLGVLLFERSRAGMKATPFCLSIRQRCQQLLTGSAEIHREARLYQGLDTGSLRFGLGIANKSLVLKSLLPDFAIQHPGIQIVVEEGKPDKLIQQLEARDIDFIIAGDGSYKQLENIQVQLIRKSALHILVSANHPLLAEAKPDINELLTFPMLSVTTTAAKHPLNEYFKPTDINRRLVCSEIGVLLEIAAKSHAWLLATEDQLADYSIEGVTKATDKKAKAKKNQQTQKVCLLPIEGFELTTDLSIIESSGRSRSPASTVFIEACFAKLTLG